MAMKIIIIKIKEKDKASYCLAVKSDREYLAEVDVFIS
jgi:hypothetical protein